mgnify:CR=1 FL=1
MKLSEWVKENIGCNSDFVADIKWADMTIVEAFKRTNNEKLLSSYRGHCDDYAIVTNGKRYYQASLFYNYRSSYGWPQYSLKVNWDKTYGLSQEEVEAVRLKNLECKNKPKTRKPIDFSYRETENWAKYQAVIEATRAFGETNDCVVKAITLATGLPYRDVHKTLEDCGRESRRGTPEYVSNKALKILGYKLVSVPKFDRQVIYAGYRRKSKGYSVKGLIGELDNKNYLINISEHMLSAVGGEILDFTRNKKCFVDSVYEIIKI